MRCVFCSSERKSIQSKIQHERLCKQNPNRDEPSRGMLGKRSHLKGTTRVHSLETRAKISASNRTRKHSEETKRKISAARKAFLAENPDRVPYVLNHYSKGPSYPERYWGDIFRSRGLSFESEFRFGPYDLDFAFPHICLDVEVDGDQHYLDGKIAEHDGKRNLYLKDKGWHTLRIRWSTFKKMPLVERMLFVDTVCSFISDFRTLLMKASPLNEGITFI